MTATIMKVPHPITPADVMDIVPQIKKAERMTVWDQENKCLIKTRTIKLDWEGNILLATINLGILEEYGTKPFNRDPVRCYKCQNFNHTARTCHAKNDICGLCGCHHRTRICVEKRHANKSITVKCHNCKGSLSTASGICPYRREVFLSQICVANPASDCTNPDTHAPETSGSAIPKCTTIALDGRLPGNHVYYMGQGQSYTWSNKQTQIIISTNQPASYIRTYNTTEDAISLRGLETSRKETTQRPPVSPRKLCCKHHRLSHFPDNKHKPLNNKFQSP